MSRIDMDRNTSGMYQVSTLQALAMGYTKKVITVGELLQHGDTGLGTFENVDGEMIVLEGRCYRALEDGRAVEAGPDLGVPFSSVTKFRGLKEFETGSIKSIADLKRVLTEKVEEGFGLNSMHVARIDGHFKKLYARSEAGYESRFVSLKEILSRNQKDFCFEKTDGSLVGIYYPDYMDGINAVGWHLHFITEDRKLGGHIFETEFDNARVRLDRISRIEIQLPADIEFDIYTLKSVSEEEIRQVEQASPGR